MTVPLTRVDVLVVGGGPAGLAAATALKAGGTGSVLVVERENDAGGIPRHCEHSGFGLRDFRRVLSGPAYARRWVDRASDAGAEIWTRTMVTGWSREGQAELTGPEGKRRVEAQAVVLATGARERPRTARLIPGDRPIGVFTTGQLQQWVHHEALPVGRRALIVGAEHVSYSAVLTLRQAGVRPIALVTDYPHSQTVRLFDLVTRLGLRVPVLTRTTVAGIYGRDRVDKVLLRGPEGQLRELPVDTVVFTGDWIPDHELARLAPVTIDPGTNGPACDIDGRTSVDWIFAVGNLVHPVETADIAARRAGFVGAAVIDWLRRKQHDRGCGTHVRVRVTDPLHWVVPNLVCVGQRADRPVLLHSTEFLEHPKVRVEQGGRTLGAYQLRRLVPNRSHHIPSDWLSAVEPAGGEVLVSISSLVAAS